MPKLRIQDELELDYECLGGDSSDLIVLIAGAGAPASFWPSTFCHALADAGARVLRYWHRDTGRSTHFDQLYAIEDLLLDLLALLEHATSPRVHLVGHSMGGYLAQMAMCRRPERFATMTSISAGSTVDPDSFGELGMSVVPEETWTRLMSNQPSGDFDRDLPGWLDAWRFLNGRRRFDESHAIDYTRSLYLGDPRNAQVAVNHVHAMSTVPASLVDELKTPRCPSLILHGTEDPLVPLDHGVATARLIPDSRLKTLDGAGHMFFDPDVWMAILDAMLAHLELRSGQS